MTGTSIEINDSKDRDGSKRQTSVKMNVVIRDRCNSKRHRWQQKTEIAVRDRQQ